MIKIKTNLSPGDLLKKCKEIEMKFKRKPKQKYYEAREIDIDILLYNDEIINLEVDSNLLLIPHKNMYERLFVLKPLLDINNEIEIFNRNSGKREKVKFILGGLLEKKYKNTNFKMDEINRYDNLIFLNKTFNVLVNGKEFNLDLANRTLLMGVINCTPDSFSIPYLNNKNPDNIISESESYSNPYDKIIDMLVKEKDNFDILDIGGESTRPGSVEISPEEEFDRIAPLLQKIRSNEILKDKIISIDTRKSYVAEESFKLGANIINDVSGGQFDENIIKVASKNFLPFICMHSRDTPQKMNLPQNLIYPDGVIQGINLELENFILKIKNKVNNLIDEQSCDLDKNNLKYYPILDWNLILDPGVGFSKTFEQNLEIIKNLDKIKNYFPNILLMGHSKKKFIQNCLGVSSSKDTLPGDIVITTISIERGANIVRVHDFYNIKQTIKISDTLFKNQSIN